MTAGTDARRGAVMLLGAVLTDRRMLSDSLGLLGKQRKARLALDLAAGGDRSRHRARAAVGTGFAPDAGPHLVENVVAGAHLRPFHWL